MKQYYLNDLGHSKTCTLKEQLALLMLPVRFCIKIGNVNRSVSQSVAHDWVMTVVLVFHAFPSVLQMFPSSPLLNIGLPPLTKTDHITFIWSSLSG